MVFKNIFFSYSRADASDFALRLAIDLQKQGFNIWIDQQDIRAGSEWDLEIEKALETCDCLLFIESEKSVVSNNVLDEVYYALEEGKRVIPLILKDSKTPFRIKRLQHIDFTKSYETGLKNLVQCLQQDVTSDFGASGYAVEPTEPAVRFYRNPLFILLLVASILIGAWAYFYFTGGKKEATPTVSVQGSDSAITVNDSVTKAEPDHTLLAKPVIEALPKKRVKVPAKDKSSALVRVDNEADLIEIFSGRWQLVSVSPRATSSKGYLTIEPIDEKRVKILSSFQFYFPKTNDTAFFSIFNGFAGCPSCILKNKMIITENDVAFATQTYQTLKETKTGVGNAGDTILNAGSNTSIAASVTLHLADNNTILIKISKQVATPISRGFIVPPFEYIFRFTKRAY